jgi:hypothetical protein
MEPVFTEDEVRGTRDPDKAIDDQVKPEPDADNASLTRPWGSRNRKDDGKAKSGPPNADEWLDFFSRIVIRFVTEWYADWCFRGIDEDLVSDSDAEKLLLEEDERKVIARPFAEFANKNPYLRKHGREIVAFADSFESMVVLGKWFARVNRIARKYNKIVSKPVVPGRSEDVNHEQSQASQNGHAASPSYTIINPGSG